MRTCKYRTWILTEWIVLAVWLTGCQNDATPEGKGALKYPVKLPKAASPKRSTRDQMATRFFPPPADVFQPPRIVEIPLPEFPGRDAIWGATGRDDRGHIWFGVAAGGVPQPSAHLFEYMPDLDEVFDRGGVLNRLEKVRPLAANESQMKIHSKIYPADDGYLYFASMDESGEKGDGSAYPTWGGHLWRMKPFASDWEHLLKTKEALIAVGGGGRWVYALGYFGHVLYQFDTRTETIQSMRVGSVGGHISRNFLVDLNGHAYVPRVRRQPTVENPKALAAELVEWDEGLHEVQAVPLPDYEATPDFESHGIVGWTFLAGGDLLFTTSTGGLWRIHPAEDQADITHLGWFHPQGRSYPAALYTFAGTDYACGIARLPKGGNQWVVYDLNRGASRAEDLNQGTYKPTETSCCTGRIRETTKATVISWAELMRDRSRSSSSFPNSGSAEAGEFGYMIVVSSNSGPRFLINALCVFSNSACSLASFSEAST